MTKHPHPNPQTPLIQLAEDIAHWAREQGFQQTGITDTNLQAEAANLSQWLDNNYHGDMQWLAEHQALRLNPEQLVPGTCRIISVRMNYLPENSQQIQVLKSPEKAYISRYALGRDYHKLMRKRLAKIAAQIRTRAEQLFARGELQQRPFVDSAPVLERPIAAKAGLGWVGKHTLLINRHAGSWFFLGEIYTSVPLPVTNTKADNQCGDCEACLKVCPTDAFVKPYQLDARRCISYLTIENKGSIPLEFREVIGNRVFGCDDCQAICPWNKFAQLSIEKDFQARHGLHNSDLVTLFTWDEKTFLKNTEGSAIRRIGYHGWLRNLAIGLGNAPPSAHIISALEQKIPQVPNWLAEHFTWALQQQRQPSRRRQRKIKRNKSQ